MKGGDYDLVVVSLGLRGFDGLRLCSQLRSLPEGRNVPILVLVSDGDRRKLNQALEMGVNDYLTRPVDRNELTARVRTQLRKKQICRPPASQCAAVAGNGDYGSADGASQPSLHEPASRTLIENSKKSEKPIAFLILDIDYFKSVNDSHGHDMGDEVLREFAKRISANVRGIDLACRYGGEEFVVVMPDTDMDLACSVAERLRRSVEEEPFMISRAPHRLNVTISIGIAGSEGEGDSAEALLHRADQALYRAKRDGRNRVVAAAALTYFLSKPLRFLCIGVQCFRLVGDPVDDATSVSGSCAPDTRYLLTNMYVGTPEMPIRCARSSSRSTNSTSASLARIARRDRVHVGAGCDPFEDLRVADVTTFFEIRRKQRFHDRSCTPADAAQRIRRWEFERARRTLDATEIERDVVPSCRGCG